MDVDPDFDAVATQLNSRLVGHERLTGGSSAHVWRLDLRGSDGQTKSVVLRQHCVRAAESDVPSIAAKEYELLRFLRRNDLPVADPLAVDPTQDLLVTSFVPGSPDVSLDQLAPTLDEMAAFLIRLHRVEITALSVAGVGEIEDPVSALDRFLPDSAAGRLLGSLLDQGQVHLHHNPAVLIHGDYWPGNVLWDNGRLAAVIDWEDSCLGDPLADLACARVELLCGYGDQAMTSFTQKYLAGAAELNLRSLPVWEAYVSATALASMHRWGLDPLSEAKRRTATTTFFERAVAELSTR